MTVYLWPLLYRWGGWCWANEVTFFPCVEEPGRFSNQSFFVWFQMFYVCIYADNRPRTSHFWVYDRSWIETVSPGPKSTILCCHEPLVIPCAHLWTPPALWVRTTLHGSLLLFFTLDALALSGPLDFDLSGVKNQGPCSTMSHLESNTGPTQYSVLCNPCPDFTFQGETCGPAVCAAACQKYWAWHPSHSLALLPQ